MKNNSHYGFSPESIPTSYERIGWQERRERIPADYGVPDYPYMPGYIFTDYERSPEFLEATLF